MSPFPFNVGWMLNEIYIGMGTCFVEVVCNFNSNHIKKENIQNNKLKKIEKKCTKFLLKN
jgi:hypothetical protein